MSLSLFLSVAQCVASPGSSGSALLPLRSPPGLWRRAGLLTHSPVSAGVHAARARVSDYSRHLGPPPRSPSLIKEQFHLPLTPLSLSLSLSLSHASPSLTSLIHLHHISPSLSLSLSLSLQTLLLFPHLSLFLSHLFLHHSLSPSLSFSLVLKRKKKGRKQEEEEAHSTALWAL